MINRPQIGLWALAMLIAGCTAANDEDLSVWMQAERSSIKPSVQPIPEPTKFEPNPYNAEGSAPPFSSEKLAGLLRGLSAAPVANAALIEPELHRRKEPLEAFPLDSMGMVGSLNRGGRLVALVKVGGLLYQVRPGQYLGQNYGRVTRISETEVNLREIVQDTGGEWIERPAALKLVEEGSK